MRKLTLQEAQKALPVILEHPERDEGFVIERNGVPTLKVTLIHNPPKKRKIHYGALRGKTHLSDCLDDEHQEEIIKMFEGREKKRK